MDGEGPMILILGTETAPGIVNAGGMESRRVSVEEIKANLRTAMENVSELVHAARGAVGDLQVSHVDVGLAISGDGSVGLVGSVPSARTEATMTVRLQFGRTLKF